MHACVIASVTAARCVTARAPARPQGMSGMSNVSMDLRDTGLSASDASGDLDRVLVEADLAETAEWP